MASDNFNPIGWQIFVMSDHAKLSEHDRPMPASTGKCNQDIPPCCRGATWPQMESAMPVVFVIICMIGIMAAINLFRAIAV